MCPFLLPDGKPELTPGWDGASPSCGLSQNARASAELGTSCAEAFSPSAAAASLSSPGVSEAPGFQACVDIPLAFADGLWEQQRSRVRNLHLSPHRLT